MQSQQSHSARLRKCLSSLMKVAHAEGRTAAKGGRMVSFKTTADRIVDLKGFVRTLHDLGYQITDIRNLKTRHIAAVAAEWERRGLSAATLQKYFSHLQRLCEWVGKPGMIRDPRDFLSDASVFERNYVATEDPMNDEQKVEVKRALEALRNACLVTWLQLMLAWAFGLRAKEAMLITPHLDDAGEMIRVHRGAKGGRPRVVPIENDLQRELIALAKTATPIRSSSLVPPEFTLKQWKSRFYRRLRSVGLTRKEIGVTAHSFRREYLNEVYEMLTGHKSPVKGGMPSVISTKEDRLSRHEVAARAGHGRIQISNAYLGSRMSKPVDGGMNHALPGAGGIDDE